MAEKPWKKKEEAAGKRKDLNLHDTEIQIYGRVKEDLERLSQFKRAIQGGVATVREEVQKAIESFHHSFSRSSLNQIESSGARAWQLQFLNKLPSTLFTGGRIESEDGEPLQIAIVDASNSLKPVSLSDSEGAPAAAAEESSEVSDATAVKSSEAPTDADEGVSGAAPAANEGSSENTEEEKSGDEEAAEETPEIKKSGGWVGLEEV
ncbi:hypothetical protein RJ640_018740 [Escallonia rubra]|uniref:Calmodulin binding protein-like N-terminal domain-containing protein n=1 Tax=Escallonia rubra TaxID=112253 RepID=A0AA88QIE6_9ASTE|nr:hypothetical protein RJ640_018740 [Escallonia rubra]